MKIKVIKFGRPAFSQFEELVTLYQKRISFQIPIENLIIKFSDEKTALLKLNKIFSQKTLGDYIVVLDERGPQWKSPEFADQLKIIKDNPRIKELILIVGGAYGIPEKIRKDADMVWCLSKLVFTSDLAWLVIWEQIYRAFSIMNNTGYHHGD